jgi:hypothetical protein
MKLVVTLDVWPGPGHRLIMAQPDTDGCQSDEVKEVFAVLFVSCGDGSELLDLTEEPSIRFRLR